MIELAPQLFGMTLEYRFLKSRAFSKAQLDSLLDRLIDSENGLALRPEQIRVRNTDLAFDYDLKAIFLGSNAVVISDSEKVYLGISGGRNDADAKLVRETAKRFLWAMEVSENEIGNFTVNMHAKAESAEKREQFLNGFRLGKEIVAPGALGYVRVPNWMEEIRFLIESSIGTTDSLFMHWSTRVHGGSWLPSLEDLTALLESVAVIFGVGFKPNTQ